MYPLILPILPPKTIYMSRYLGCNVLSDSNVGCVFSLERRFAFLVHERLFSFGFITQYTIKTFNVISKRI